MKTEEIKDLFERFESIACEYDGIELAMEEVEVWKNSWVGKWLET